MSNVVDFAAERASQNALTRFKEMLDEADNVLLPAERAKFDEYLAGCFAALNALPRDATVEQKRDALQSFRLDFDKANDG